MEIPNFSGDQQTQFILFLLLSDCHNLSPVIFYINGLCFDSPSAVLYVVLQLFCILWLGINDPAHGRRCWSEISFKVPSNPNHLVVLGFETSIDLEATLS